MQYRFIFIQNEQLSGIVILQMPIVASEIDYLGFELHITLSHVVLFFKKGGKKAWMHWTK